MDVRGTLSTAVGWSRRRHVSPTEPTRPTFSRWSGPCACVDSACCPCSTRRRSSHLYPRSPRWALASSPTHPRIPRGPSQTQRPFRTSASTRTRACTRSPPTSERAAGATWTSACPSTRTWPRLSSRICPRAHRGRRCMRTRWRLGWAPAACRSPSRHVTCTRAASSRTSSPRWRPFSSPSPPPRPCSRAASWTRTAAGM
mmetsp:Transcript_7375/g.20089  ORF Transcript_7375/g.20089 Transcript_7375/m.20089 type:complete len:200 (-) Transcript_7375:1679-2278(-)